MKYSVLFFVCLFMILTNKTIAQTTYSDNTNKKSYILSSANELFSESNFSLYHTAIQNFSSLDEFRFLNERRIIEFEKDQITIELFSANELSEKYGKEVPVNTIIPGSNYLPVKFQLINWENTYTIHPLFDKSNELTH